ncbi:MAG: response regulator transcription factor, partial [Lachnospiraceae bacterium]|nr:response regulator transcription factor [Lachnospiraceae bacterium]
MKLLVVEDDLTLSTGICFELDSNGYLTVAAYNCKKAHQLIQSDHFDLAILDVNLPDGNGFDLCHTIKKMHPQMPVIFLSANDLEQDILNGFDLGAEDYVTKPFNMKILLRRIEVAVRRNPASEQQTVNGWSDGFLSLDFSKLTAARRNEKIIVTANEYKLLKI